MRLQKQATKKRRSAATAVEFALVCPIVLGLLFSILEYSRYLMVLHVSDNAVREAARFALARTDTLQTNVTNTTIEAQLNHHLSQASLSLKNRTIQIYKSNQAGEPLNYDGAIVSDVASAAKFDETKFGDYITVKLSGDYEPVLPSLLMLAPSITVTKYAVMCSEGN